MLKLVNRSRSMRSLRAFGGRGEGASGAGRGKTQEDPAVVAAPHGPESPVLGEPGPVSDFQQARGQDPSITLNGDAPSSPVSSSAGAATTDDVGNPYVRRPLPQPPPSRQQAQAVMERPSTSAGPGSSSNSRMMFGGFAASSTVTGGNNNTVNNKRMSRDDLYINTKAGNNRSFRSYHIPIRGKPPSPSPSPRSRTPEATIPVRTQTPDSMDGNSRGPAPIGMALGSPGYAPPTTYAANWQPQNGGSGFQFQLEDANEPIPTKKAKKKGIFGLFGGKKESKGRERGTPDSMNMAFESRPTTSAGKQSIQLDRSISEKKSTKHKPPMIRSQTAPAIDSPLDFKEPRTPRSILSRKASNIKKSDISAPVPIPAVPAFPSININGMPPLPSSNFLDVEIPSIKMDRYSVMFSGILQTQGLGGPANRNSQSNLLARRQATLDKLKTINDAIVREEEARLREREEALLKPIRRATSPLHAKSPSFSLFPTPPTTKVPIAPKLSPRSRSNTSPAHLASPSKAAFERPQAQAPKRPVIPAARPVETHAAARTETPEMRSRSQMSQQSQDITILLEPEVAHKMPAAQPVASAQLAPQPQSQPQPTAQEASEPTPAPAGAQRPAALRKPVQSQTGSKTYRRERPGSRGRPMRDPRERSQSREPAARKPVPAIQGAALTTQPPTTQVPVSKVPQSRKPASQRQEQRQEQRQDQPQYQEHRQAQSQQPHQQAHPQHQGEPAPRSRIPQPIQTTFTPPRPAPQAQPQAASNFGPEKSALILDSPTSDVDPSSMDAPPPMASISTTMSREPTWQMASPPSSTTSSRKRSPSSASSVQTVQTHVTKPSIDESDVTLKSAVEISIARQISLSQQQRQLLRPLETNVSAPGTASGRRDPSPASSNGRSPVRKLAVGKNERLGEAKTGTPTVVSRDGFDARAENRRSERIVVEGY